MNLWSPSCRHHPDRVLSLPVVGGSCPLTKAGNIFVLQVAQKLCKRPQGAGEMAWEWEVWGSGKTSIKGVLSASNIWSVAVYLMQATCFLSHLRVCQRGRLRKEDSEWPERLSWDRFLVTVMPKGKFKYKQTCCHPILFRQNPSWNQRKERDAFWKYLLLFELANLKK